MISEKDLLLSSKWTISVMVLMISSLIGGLLYIGFFMDRLPRFFASMENTGKNILAVLIIVFTVYALLKIVV